MSLHTTSRYDEELNDLRTHVLSMGERVQSAIHHATEVTFKLDRSIAQHTIEQDKSINALELECDEMTRTIIVRRQPTGNDLRFIIACNKIVTDLERMGDLAAGICRSTLRIGDHPLPDLGELSTLAEKVRHQVARVLNAYGRDDMQDAMHAISDDDEIDELNARIYQDLLDQMAKDPSLISGAIILTSISKNLERIADLASSIAEMVVYVVSGKDIRHISLDAASHLLDQSEGRE